MKNIALFLVALAVSALVGYNAVSVSAQSPTTMPDTNQNNDTPAGAPNTGFGLR